MGRSIEIEINTSDPAETGPVLHKAKLDQLRWIAENRPYTVKFNTPDGSPFASAEFEVKHNQPTDSGPVRSDAPIKEYHYNIYPGLQPGPNVAAVDPKVIIKP